MLFNSHVFLFAFLPLTLAGFLILRHVGWTTVCVIWLLGASLVFYGWWNPHYLFLIVAVMAFNFGVGRLLSHLRRGSALSILTLMMGVGIDLAILGYYKYANFFIANLDATSGGSWALDRIVLPLAISFYIFQEIAFLVDVYRGEVRADSFLRYALFVIFFPQLIAGPIIRFQEVEPQYRHGAIMQARTRRGDIAIGMSILAIGLFKKVVIADGVSVFSTPIFHGVANGATIDMVEAWTGALAYSFQLYFDFSGYSDMAVGLARIFGIRLPVNFWSPYKANSIIDFWRRWHITLSGFLRDYLYIPLGGNRKGQARRHVNVLITMLLGGLWHGANWTFVVWGGIHGIFLVLNHLWRKLPEKLRLRRLFCASWTARLLTFVTVVVAWVFFRSDSLADAEKIVGAMFGANGISFPRILAHHYGAISHMLGGFIKFDGILPNDLILYERRPWVLPVLASLLAICWLMPNSYQIMRRHRPAIRTPEQRADAKDSLPIPQWRPSTGWSVVIALVFFVAILAMGDGVSEFLYFQF